MQSFVTYSQLGKLLLDLGFTDDSGTHLVFRHAIPSALVRMAFHEPDEPVLERDLVMVGAILRLNGLRERDAFEQWVLDQKRQHEAAAG